MRTLRSPLIKLPSKPARSSSATLITTATLTPVPIHSRFSSHCGSSSTSATIGAPITTAIRLMAAYEILKRTTAATARRLLVSRISIVALVASPRLAIGVTRLMARPLTCALSTLQ